MSRLVTWPLYLFLNTFLFLFQNVAAVAVETNITFPQVEQVKVDFNRYFITMYNYKS